MAVAVRAGTAMTKTAVVGDNVWKPSTQPTTGDIEFFFGTRRLGNSNDNGRPADSNNGGWSLLGRWRQDIYAGASPNATTSVYWRVHPGTFTDAEYTWNCPTASAIYAYFAVSGGSNATPTFNGKTASTSTTWTVPTLTEVVDGGLILFGAGAPTAASTATANQIGGQPTHTEQTDHAIGSTTSNRLHFTSSFAPTDSTGTSPAYTYTVTQTATYLAGCILVAPAGGTTQEATASLSQTSTLSATAVADRIASASLSQTNTVSATAVPTRIASASLSQTSVLYASIRDKVSTLTDPFTSLDTNKWTAANGFTVESGRARGAPSIANGAYEPAATLTSVLTYDATESALVFQIPTPPPASAFSEHWLIARLQQDANNHIDVQIYCDSTVDRTVIGRSRVAGVSTTRASIAFNATDHTWLKISVASGVAHWWGAPDASGSPGTWTEIGTGWTVATLTLTNVTVYFEVGGERTLNSPGYAEIDNVNPGAVTHEGAATFAQTSTLSATAIADRVATAALTQTATLSATAIADRVATAALTQTSSLSATAIVTQFATATLSQTNALSATAIADRVAAATLTQTNTLSATAIVTRVAAATLSQTNTLSATAIADRVAAATLTQTSILSATAIATRVAAATLTQTSLLSATAIADRVAAATLTQTSTLSATAVVDRVAAATLVQTSVLSATALATRIVSAALTQANTLSATAIADRVAAATLIQTSALSAEAVVERVAEAILSQASALSAEAALATLVEAVLAQDSTLSATAIADRVAAATLIQTSALSAEGFLETFVEAVLTQASALSAEGFLETFVEAVLTQTSALSAEGFLETFVEAVLTQDSVLSAEGTYEQPAEVVLLQSSTLSVAGLVDRVAIVTLSQPSVFGVIPGLARVERFGLVTLSQASVLYGLVEPRIFSATVTFAQTATLYANATVIRNPVTPRPNTGMIEQSIDDIVIRPNGGSVIRSDDLVIRPDTGLIMEPS